MRTAKPCMMRTHWWHRCLCCKVLRKALKDTLVVLLIAKRAASSCLPGLGTAWLSQASGARRLRKRLKLLCCVQQVRVLSVQRTSRAFDARFSACARTYHYYLPLHILRPCSAGAQLFPVSPAHHACMQETPLSLAGERRAGSPSRMPRHPIRCSAQCFRKHDPCWLLQATRE